VQTSGSTGGYDLIVTVKDLVLSLANLTARISVPATLLVYIKSHTTILFAV